MLNYRSKDHLKKPWQLHWSSGMPWQTMDPGSSTFALLSIGPIVEHSNEERVIKTLGP